MRTFAAIMRRIILIGWVCSLGVACAPTSLTTSVPLTPASTLTNAALSMKVASAAAATTSTVAVAPGIPFEIVAQGSAFVGEGKASVTQALRGDTQLQRAMSANLPDEAQAALKAAFTHPDPVLYIVIYAGQQPSTGYTVRILSITPYNEAGVDKLAVNYTLDKPSPSQGGATVMTHPYVIARVANTNVRSSDVMFVEQKSAP